MTDYQKERESQLNKLRLLRSRILLKIENDIKEFEVENNCVVMPHIEKNGTLIRGKFSLSVGFNS